MRTLLLATPLALIAAAAPAAAQIETPPLSPRAVVEQQVGLTKVTLDYSRPGVKGRKIFGELEPWGAVWRTGANASTKVTFEEAVTFGGESVPAGKYGLYSIPGEDSWTVILSKQTELWGAGGYDPKEDQVRVEVTPITLPSVHETFTIDLQSFEATGADFVIAWETTKIVVPLGVDTNSKVMAQIDEQVRNAEGEVAPRIYFDAAMYLMENGGDLEEAAGWMKTAVDASPGAFWMSYYQAELAHRMGDMELARAAATKSLEEAEASERGDFGYAGRARRLLEKLD